MTRLGEHILALVEQGKSSWEIMDICNASRSTVLKYRKQYMEEHLEEEMPDPNWKPSTSEKERRLRVAAISADEIADVRKSIRVGDTISLRSFKISTSAKKEPINGRVTKGTVVNTRSRHFCVVRLANGVMESVLWSDLVKAKRGGVAG